MAPLQAAYSACRSLGWSAEQLRDPDDEHAPRRLRCRGKGKMRYALEPADVYLEIDPEAGASRAASRRSLWARWSP